MALISKFRQRVRSGLSEVESAAPPDPTGGAPPPDPSTPEPVTGASASADAAQ